MKRFRDPCWSGYEMIGKKKKNGKSVPNCVPVKEGGPGFVGTPGSDNTSQYDLSDLGNVNLPNGQKDLKVPKYPSKSKKKVFSSKPSNREWGTKSLEKIYKKETPGQHAEETLIERGEDSKGYYRSTETGAGLTQKGAKHFGIHTAVTGKVKPGSTAAKRRKSFCARMGGMPGPMKDEKGQPTRKAASLRRWRCRL